MRKKLIIASTAVVLTVGGVVAAMPVLADTGSTTAGERIREALAGLVDDGSLTDEQADEVATTLSKAGIGRPGHHRGHLDLETAATALGMTTRELRTALAPEGTTLADVAEAQDVDVGTLVDALVRHHEERIAQAVEGGRLTQDEAAERLADLAERVTERVTSADLGGRGHHGPRGPAGD